MSSLTGSPEFQKGRKSGFVAIVGRPNAGKSTLVNRVLGSKVSIVTPKAQTTRENVLGILTENQGQMIFVDTPGIHQARPGGLNAYMVGQAAEALNSPLLAWYLVDPSSELKHEAVVLEMLARSRAPTVLLINKTDRVKGAGARARVKHFEETLLVEAKARGIDIRGTRQISAMDGAGVSELVSESWELLPEGPLYFPDEDQISDRPVRFFVAEKIREQLFLLLGEELPYSCAVKIEKFDERANPPRIEATIFVERDSQKGIVVGKGGQKIREVGTAARREVEAFVGHQVFLGLNVKLLKDWSRNAEALKGLGYLLPEKRGKTEKRA